LAVGVIGGLVATYPPLGTIVGLAVVCVMVHDIGVELNSHLDRVIQANSDEFDETVEAPIEVESGDPFELSAAASYVSLRGASTGPDSGLVIELINAYARARDFVAQVAALVGIDYTPEFASNRSTTERAPVMPRTLSVELAPSRVNSIHPGIVGDSPFWAGKTLDAVVASTLTGRLATMAEVVGASIFLLENSSANGVDLVLDGGWR
jgi:NAD(P)-dependent dehydrogenase (short-subunit alcohol dehydrogenase family)